MGQSRQGTGPRERAADFAPETGQLPQLFLDLADPAPQELADAIAGGLSREADAQNLADFFQPEADGLGLANETQTHEDVVRVHAIPRGGARRDGEQTELLVVAYRLGTQAGRPGDFSDEESFGHEDYLTPYCRL